jgi:hypothetical protein
MRLITGATWSPEDIAAYQRGVEALHTSLDRSLVHHFAPSEEECIRLGLPPGWRPEEDQIALQRFGTLAWMVWAGLLEVRIALPLDDAGRPYHPGRQRGFVSSQGRYPVQWRWQYHCLSGLRE